jgi:hypothetical protein
VIFGASNRPGNAYAHFLAERGFNLILISRDIQPLNDLEIALNNTNNSIVIHKVVVNQFDEDSLNRNLKDVNGLPVKIFVNCVNSKRKTDKRGEGMGASLDGSQTGLHESTFDANSNKILTREEVYYTGKENIEGYACLVNYFMKSLACSSDYPALINVDNDENFNEEKMKEGQLFF